MKNPIRIVRIIILVFGLIFFFAGAGIFYAMYSAEGMTDEPFIVPIVLMAVGLIDVIIVSIWSLIAKRKEQKEMWLLQNGQTIKAKLTAVDQNLNLKVNNRSPYIIKCEWRDPITTSIHTFKSKNIWIDPGPYIDSNKAITVFYDPANMKSYVVDTSFLPDPTF